MVNEIITPTSYLPKYAVLDEMLKNIINQNQTVCLYFDTKNILSSLHSVTEQQRLIQSFKSNSDRFIIARTIILIANHWMRYFKRRNIGCNIFFFDERGSSVYHNIYSKKYKENRKISKQRIASELLLEEDFYDKYYKVYDDNISVASGLFSILNNLFYIKLKDLESDFIPKLLMNEYFTTNGVLDNKYLHFIIGNDKDFGQLLTFNNVFQICRIVNEKRFELRSSINIMEKFVKMGFDDSCKLRNANFIPLILAVSGDEADNVRGIKGLGNINFYKYLNKLYCDSIITDDDYTAEKFYHKIEEYKKLNPNYFTDVTTLKLLSEKEQILTNYKLTSFNELLDWLQLSTKNKILSQLEKQPSNDEVRRKLLASLCINKGTYDYLL